MIDNMIQIHRAFVDFCHSTDRSLLDTDALMVFKAGWNHQADQLMREIEAGERAIHSIHELGKELQEERRFSAEIVGVLASAQVDIARLAKDRRDLLSACEVAVSVLQDIYGRESSTSGHGQRVRSDISENIGFIQDIIAKTKDQAP